MQIILYILCYYFFITINLISLIFYETLFVDYYEVVNGIVNDVSHKHNTSILKKLQKVSMEKDELFQTAKVNAQEAR